MLRGETTQTRLRNFQTFNLQLRTFNSARHFALSVSQYRMFAAWGFRGSVSRTFR
jgi:hypothetical protein